MQVQRRLKSLASLQQTHLGGMRQLAAAGRAAAVTAAAAAAGGQAAGAAAAAETVGSVPQESLCWSSAMMRVCGGPHAEACMAKVSAFCCHPGKPAQAHTGSAPHPAAPGSVTAAKPKGTEHDLCSCSSRSISRLVSAAWSAACMGWHVCRSACREQCACRRSVCWHLQHARQRQHAVHASMHASGDAGVFPPMRTLRDVDAGTLVLDPLVGLRQPPVAQLHQVANHNRRRPAWHHWGLCERSPILRLLPCAAHGAGPRLPPVFGTLRWAPSP